jgi:c-di-GMP-binding flagellar brake protein YcgR
MNGDDQPAPIHRPFFEGQPLRIMVPVGEVTYPFASQVVAVDESGFEVSIPLRKGIRVPLRPEQMVSILGATPDGLYSFDARIRPESAPTCRFDWPSDDDLTRLQRRRHRRVPLLNPMPVMIQADPEWGMDFRIPCELKELSASGCALWIDASLMEGMPVVLNVGDAGSSRIQLVGEVVHNTHAIWPLPEGNRHVTGLVFNRLDPVAQGWVTKQVLQMAG